MKIKYIKEMKPTTAKKITRLYVLDLLIQKRALELNQGAADIKHELQELLGITPQHLGAIRRSTTEESGYLNTSQLLKLAEYFGCDISDLINKDLQSSHSVPGANVST